MARPIQFTLHHYSIYVMFIHFITSKCDIFYFRVLVLLILAHFKSGV